MRRVLAIVTLIILLTCANGYNAVYASANECVHSWQWVIDEPPTCAEKGFKHERCSKCELTRSIGTSIPPTEKHKYENACDTVCNVCEAKRKVNGHSYKNKCDADCDICGAKRYVGSHKYATYCDSKCIYCGCAREKVSHKYTNSCDTVCNNCGSVRKITHKYKDVITKATISQNGKVTKKCTICSRVAYKNTLYRVKTVKLKQTEYSYTGKAVRPALVIENSKGKKISSKYYTATYSRGRKSIGTYKVTVTFKGRYKGKKVLTFKINPKATTIVALKTGKNSFTVKYKKQTTSGGYRIQYSTSKKFKSAKTVKISGNKTVSKTVKKLKSKKTYYIRVRTYKKVGTKTYYSNWSKIEKIKTK